MIAADQLKKIVSQFGNFNEEELIDVDGDVMQWNQSEKSYILTRPDGRYKVKGIGWGYGILFVKVDGGELRYSHEITEDPEEMDAEENDEYEITEETEQNAVHLTTQAKLTRWFNGCC